MTEELDNFLAHYGVRGMKWGKRNDEAVLSRIAGYKVRGETKEDKQRFKDYKKSTTRSERKTDKIAVNTTRAQFVLNQSMKSPLNFVQVGTPGYPTLMQGKEFVQFLEKGGAFNPMTTAVTDLRLKKDLKS